MNASTRLRLQRSAAFGVFAFVLQLVAIWMLYPGPSDFVPVKQVSGTYEFDGGSAGTRTYTNIGRQALTCVVSIWGPEDACTQRLKGKHVTATIGRYRSMFSTHDVVVSLKADDGTGFESTREELVMRWLEDSVAASLEMAFLGALVFNAAAGIIALRREKRLEE